MRGTTDTLMIMDPESLELSVPANAEYLSTARLFAAAAARHFSAVEDAVEDLRLAVSEASTLVLQRSPSPSALRVDVQPLPGGVAVRIHTTADLANRSEPAEPAVPAAMAPSENEERTRSVDGWGTELLQALVDDLVLQTQADGQLEAAFMFAFDRASSGDGDGAGLDTTGGERSRRGTE
jgi:anti-sigma regulatory factor (Ser/Thr protein kinase)